MLVEEIMQRRVITIDVDDTVLKALEVTQEHRIRHLPVMEGTRMVGIVSDRDLRDVSPSVLIPYDAAILKETLVQAIMKTPVITAHPLDGLEEAARTLYEHRIGCLPVVKAERLLGIVSETDILRTLIELVGTLEPGSVLEIQVPDRPGALADIAQIVKMHRINLSSVLVRTGKKPNTRLVTIKLQAKIVDQIIEDIDNLGYKVLWPFREGDA